MLKQFAGCEGVKSERVEEAMALKHCALSLVGEPIMYPHIDRFIDLLHEYVKWLFMSIWLIWLWKWVLVWYYVNWNIIIIFL